MKHALLLVIALATFLRPSVGADVAPKADPEAARVRVALGEFCGGENDYPRRAALESLASQVSALVGARGDNDWLERVKLDEAAVETGLAQSGALDPAATVAVGRWLRAEMVVLGGLRGPAGSARELRLQIVETATADVLAEAVVPIAEELTSWASSSTSERVADTIGKLLEAAKARRRAVAERLRIAVPFFQSDRGGRLDALADAIRAACRVAGEESSDCRVLRFPAPGTSRAEDELALAGLAEPSPAMLGLELADAWAWGSFEEVESSGVPFPEVRVKVVINVWRAGRLRHTTVEGRAGKLDELARDTAAEVLALARAGDGEERMMSREEVGRMLFAKAEPWIAELLPSGSLESTDGLARHRALVRMLELAAFFLPSDVRIARELLVERWREDRFDDTGVALYENLALSKAWRSHCEAFGFDFRLPDLRKRGAALYSDNRNPHREPAAAYLALRFGSPWKTNWNRHIMSRSSLRLWYHWVLSVEWREDAGALIDEPTPGRARSKVA
jgi:hypothetical protein